MLCRLSSLSYNITTCDHNTPYDTHNYHKLFFHTHMLHVTVGTIAVLGCRIVPVPSATYSEPQMLR